jgi:phage shock protein PspC (stress-responsive transcriptional regulator)
VQDLSIYLNKVAAGVAQLLQSDWALVTLHQVVIAVFTCMRYDREENRL